MRIPLPPLRRWYQRLDRWAEAMAADPRFLWKLFFLALAFRVAWVLWHPTVNLVADMLGYHESGLSLLNSGELRVKGRISASRPPVYPLFLYLVYYLFGPGNLLAVRLIQTLMGAAIAVITFHLGRKVVSRKVGVWAGLLYALYPAAWGFNDMVMTETLFTLLLTGGVYYLLEVPRGRYQDAVIAGVLLGLATLTRTVLFQFPLFLAGLYLLFSRDRLKHLPKLAAFAAAFWMVLLPWMARNQRVFGTPLLTTKSGVDLFQYNHNPFSYILNNYSLEDTSYTKGLQGWMLTELERDQLTRDIAVNWIKEHPLLFAFKGVRMQWNFFGVDREYAWWIMAGYWGKAPRWQTAFVLFFFGPWIYLVLPLAIWGMVYAWKRYFHSMKNLLILILYNLAVTFVYYGFSRNRMPLIPLFLVLAGYALTQLPAMLDDLKVPGVLRRPAPAVALSLLAFCLIGWVLEIYVDFGSALGLGFTGFDWGEISK
ncbi:MAG: hypothetical protein C4524_03225 [Candidatus Zixiibacteriota bacterium]|nr:MAG: hypothetical protein C4524_03225 [candidate division Zixibacteria bacterium]